MTPCFKVIHIRDAIATYDRYIDMGKPDFGHAFELIMTKHTIDRVNNKVGRATQTISLNKDEFDSYMQIIHHSSTHSDHIK